MLCNNNSQSGFMKILFVHQNFPAQFRHLAPALARRGYHVNVLTAESNLNQTPIPTSKYKWDHKQKPVGPGTRYAEHSQRGLHAARAAAAMQAQGYVPDLIIGHPGWGETLFLKEVWPNAKLLHFAEFYYATKGLDMGFDPEFSRDSLNARIGTICGQAHLAHALCLADMNVTPTQFQAATFPPMFRDRLRVIHEGVDTMNIAPDAGALFNLPNGVQIRAADEVITFVNRNLEPYRGFHIFMRALPKVMKARPNAQVVIVGEEKRGYGPLPKAGTWKEKMLAELGGKLDHDRIHFLGRVPYADFKTLMQISRVHAYLTYPFVLSWSMLEAMAMEAHVVASNTAPVAEVIQDGVNGQLVDFFDVPAWSAALIDGLANPEKFRRMRRRARETIVQNYDLNTRCLPQQVALVEQMLKRF